MRALLAGACAVLLSGCWDFQAARAQCEDAGACEVADDGGRVPPEVDAGPVPSFNVLPTPFVPDGGLSTSSFAQWEYPYPAGYALHHLAVVSDKELWASGDDDIVVHLRDGEAPRYERLPAGASGLRNPHGARLVMLRDGTVLAAGEGSLQQWNGAAWSIVENWSFSPDVAVLGKDGLAWFGGAATAGPPCGADTAVVREGLLTTTERCLSQGRAAVVALDPAGWALDTTGVLSARSESGWSSQPSFGTTIDRDTAGVLALPGGSFLVTGGAAGRLLAVDATGQAAPRPVISDFADQREVYRSLARTSDGGVLLAGTAGAFWLQRDGGWARETPDAATELEAVAAGPRSEYAVGTRGQVLRRVAGQWRPLIPGAVAPIVDSFVDAQGGLWAVGGDGTLLRRDAEGWAVQGSLPPAGVGLTQTRDGRLWAVGKRSVSTSDGGLRGWVPALANSTSGPQGFSSVIDFNGVAGTELGRTWIYGDGIIYVYDSGGWSVGPKGMGMTVLDLFVTDAGTAWAALGQGAVMYFDGGAWSAQRTLPNAGECTSVWAPSAAFAYVACAAGNFRSFPDGTSEPWDASSPAFRLAGTALTDGGHVIYGAQGADVWVSAPGSTPSSYSLGLDFSVNRLRVAGSKLYLVGDRDGPHGGVLSTELLR